MIRRFFASIGLILIASLGAGCGQMQNSTETPQPPYTVHIQTSEIDDETRIAALREEPAMLDTIFDSVGITMTVASTMTGDPIVTELDGIISTKSKEWHLYINNSRIAPIHLDTVPVRTSDLIAWKYEAPTTL